MTLRTDPKVESIFIEEPRQEAYKLLVDGLVSLSASFLLVERDHVKLSEEAQSVFRQLLPFRRQRVRATEWPGTQLLGSGSYAYISDYPAVPEAVGILKAAVIGLYEWKQPKRPEDLCFIARDGEPTLVTIAHEKQAWVRLSQAELEQLRAHVGSRFFGKPL